MGLTHLGTLVPSVYGISYFVTEHAVERRWVFPEDRFVEYEPKDEAWARPLGYGHEEVVPAAYVTNGRWWIHPELMPYLERATRVMDSAARHFWEREFGNTPIPKFVIEQ